MTRPVKLLKWHDHAAALLAALVVAHVIGLIEFASWLPQGSVTLDGLRGQMIAAAVCVLSYLVLLAAMRRRRIVKGPLYRCGETRPVGDLGASYQSTGDRLLDGWQYR